MARAVRQMLGIMTVLCLLWPVSTVAIVLEGTGMATIHAGNVEAAREEARKSALRDVALQYDARISSEDTVENGVLKDSRLKVASHARARNVQIIDERELGNMLRVTVRADMSEGARSCNVDAAASLKKRVAVTGFTLQYPEHARQGRLDDAGQVLPQQLQAGLREEGNLQVLSASTLQLFSDVGTAPTHQHFDNRLSNVVQVARELGAQFVVAGVIRDMDLEHPSAWGTSVLHKIGRGVGATNQNRRFVVDMMIFDGFSGSPVYQQQFQAQGRWDAPGGASVGFGSAAFQETEFGQQVGNVMKEMQHRIQEALACQPFMTRITRVEGQQVTIESGATAGLRPGDRLELYRSYSHFDSPGATPELLDADTELTLNNVHPEFANGRIPEYGSLENIQRGDIAIIW